MGREPVPVKQYDLKVRRVRQVHRTERKALWRLETRSGTLALKLLPKPREYSLFAMGAHEHISGTGGLVPGVVRTKGSDLLVEHDGRFYAVITWVQGRHPEAPRHLPDMLAGLARFHQASRGYVPPPEARVSSKLGRWPEQYDRMVDQLHECKEAAARQGLKADVLRLFDRAAAQALAVKDRLLRSAYADWAARSDTLCHQDFGEGNCLLTQRGAYVIDLDNVTFDLPARDLRKAILQYGVDRTADILKAYERVSPLTPEQREVVYIDVLFPHSFHNTVKHLRTGKVPKEAVVAAAAFEAAKAERLARQGCPVSIPAG